MANELQDVLGWVSYINTKDTKANSGIPHSAFENEAYSANDKTVVLPYFYGFRITLPADESDGTTASNQTLKFLNAFRLPVKVTYSGVANA
jgi:hypothetical protein